MGLERALALFAVPVGDRVAVRAADDAVRRDAALAAWVAQAAAALVAAMGNPSPGPSLPPRPLHLPGVAAYLPVVAFVRVLPELLAEHKRRGVTPQVTADTLADVGRMLVRNRAWCGEVGLGDELTSWLTRHGHGAIVQLGRLQFERRRLVPGPGLELRQAGFPCGPGDLVLDLHIPGNSGRLLPGSVDASLAAARTFFRKRYGEERYAALVCHSWLLDPQLVAMLPPSSNLVAFQSRFTLGGEPGDGDRSVRRFLWDDAATPWAQLPRDSTLRRAVLDLWAGGGHWHERGGWLPWR
ncbi:acyltransferase domain-containing protein [Dermatophilaceae bacterium Soc4.6]